MPNFPKKLKQLRNERKLKQSEVAIILNVSTRNYQRYEHGNNEPNINGLIKLADFFDVSLDYLVGRTDNPNSHKN